VPDVRGDTVPDARDRLQDEDLLVDTREQSNRTVDEGRVITTEPPPGSDVDCSDGTVTLVVSKGENLILLPDVLGDQQSVAESDLEQQGFVVDIDTRDADEEEGTVIGQNPGPGSQLRRGARITLTVSTGAGSIVMPSVEGQPRDTAANQLLSEGLNVDVVEQEVNDESEDDRVVDQAPASGTRLRQGDRVTIFVGVFIEEPEIEGPAEPLPQEGSGDVNEQDTPK
jgi:serine/threonine-protein kinase